MKVLLTNMSPEDILLLIPQRPPFVMVDKLLSCDENSSKTSFRVDEENVLVVKGEFSEEGLIENIAQSAAAHAGYLAMMKNIPVTVGYISTVSYTHLRAHETGRNLVCR